MYITASKFSLQFKINTAMVWQQISEKFWNALWRQCYVFK